MIDWSSVLPNVCPSERLTTRHKLTGSLTDWLTDALTFCLMIDWQLEIWNGQDLNNSGNENNRVTELRHLQDWHFSWLAGQPTDQLNEWLTDYQLTGWLAGQLTDWLTDCMITDNAKLVDRLTVRSPDMLDITFAFKALSGQTPKETFTLVAVSRHLSRPDLKFVRGGIWKTCHITQYISKYKLKATTGQSTFFGFFWCQLLCIHVNLVNYVLLQ